MGEMTEAEIASIATAVATKAAALAAAEVLATAAAAAIKADSVRVSSDHDDFIRLQVQAAGLKTDIQVMKADVLDAVGRVDKKASDISSRVEIQNGRVAKLEVRWIQSAAVIAFLLVVLPLLLAAVALITR